MDKLQTTQATYGGGALKVSALEILMEEQYYAPMHIKNFLLDL